MPFSNSPDAEIQWDRDMWRVSLPFGWKVSHYKIGIIVGGSGDVSFCVYVTLSDSTDAELPLGMGEALELRVMWEGAIIRLVTLPNKLEGELELLFYNRLIGIMNI